MAVHASPQQAMTRPLGGRRVLIAESVLRSRETLTEAVRGLGARDLVCAERGSDAMEELRSTRYDLVICGQVYGDGYDAGVLLERIREERLIPPAGTLIAISAERSSRTVAALAAHGPDACVLRPFSAGQFRERLLQVVAHKRRLQPVMAAIDAGDCGTALEVCRLFDAKASDLKVTGYRAVCEHLIGQRALAQAENVLGEARAAGEAPWMSLALARIRSLQGEHEQARDMLRKLVEERPEFIASYDALAGIEAGQGEFANALRHLQEATGRSGFSLKRLRQAGEVATRGGDLALAERVLDRVIGKVHDSDLTRSSDYVNLVEVLAARGKLNRADRVAAQLRSAHSEDPDSAMVGPLLAWRRALDEATPVAVRQAFEALLDAYERIGHQASMEMRMQVLEACVDQGAREDAYALARSVVSAGIADRLALKRVRQLLERMSG